MNESKSSPLVYERRSVLHVHVMSTNGEILGDDELRVILTEPAFAWSQAFQLSEDNTVWGSACVISGLDPRGGYKACQDLCFIEVFEDVLLAGEFDGHGQEGEPVVNFCKRFAGPYLKSHIEQARTQPQQFLTSLNEDCDKNLKKAVDCRASGCTAVIVLYVSGCIYFSCVGDSRAILATTAPHKGFTQPPRREDKQLLDEIKVKRLVTPDVSLAAIQLTQDQKPEDPEELKRIRKAGGLVMRLEDENGMKVGPYRVWKVEGMYPGIAMSRSLGDVIAQEIGVISTPVVTSYPVDSEHDYFLVLGSDGIWDVMENQEVCDFVEAFRNKSPRESTHPQVLEVVTPGKVTISQLLCEEARARWLSVVEAEDVLIDDISCIVLELKIVGERKRAAPKRAPAPIKETEDVPGLEQGILRSKTKVVDARRESTSGTMPQAVVKDPRRSSISHFDPPLI
jgi:serine/threonine protein phosphatase PrpC